MKFNPRFMIMQVKYQHMMENQQEQYGQELFIIISHVFSTFQECMTIIPNDIIKFNATCTRISGRKFINQ